MAFLGKCFRLSATFVLQKTPVRTIKRYVAPTLMHLKKREQKAGGKVINPRNTYLEWNQEAEIFAFGKRLNEEFDSDLLLQAFTDRSYVVKEKSRQKEIGFELKIDDNIKLADKGDSFMRDYILAYLEHALPRFPAPGIKSVRDYLVSEEVLSNVSLHLGTTDLILCDEYPIQRCTLAHTLKAVIGALIQSSGEEKAAHFIRDFIITQLNGQDVNDLWPINNPLEMLYEVLKHFKLSEVEPRLIGEVGKNTLLACYRVGLYQEKELLSTGFGESIAVARETAARQALKKFFGTEDHMAPINFKLRGVPKHIDAQLAELTSN